MDWARQRSMLWTLAEYSEDVKEARVARAYIANLPASAGAGSAAAPGQGFAQSLADRFGNAVDFAVHAPHPGRTGAAHVHFLASAREVQLDGFGRITLAASHHQARRIRELWLDHQAEAGLAATIEPQAKAGQGAEHATRTRAIASWLQLKARLNPSMTLLKEILPMPPRAITTFRDNRHKAARGQRHPAPRELERGADLHRFCAGPVHSVARASKRMISRTGRPSIVTAGARASSAMLI